VIGADAARATDAPNASIAAAVAISIERTDLDGTLDPMLS